MDGKRETDELRQEIAKLDAQLLVVLEKRARASRRVGELRKDQPPSLPLQDRAAIRALLARSTGDMPQESLRSVLREVFASCTALELPVRVAFVGPDGGTSHAAVRGRFGASANTVSLESTQAAFDEVTRRRAEYAVVPFETQPDGPVQSTIAALTATDLKVCEVLESQIDVHLMNRTGNAADIEKVFASPQDHARCQRALTELAQQRSSNGGKLSVLDVRSPLMACQIAVEDHGGAALASEVFGASLGLEVARRNVLDQGAERIRYAVVGTRPSSRTGSDLTAFVFSVQDAPGSLLDALKQFSERGINLTKIQSRPTEGPREGEEWAYLFFVEVAGHSTDRTLITAFEEIKRVTRFFKVLGSYPV